MAHLQADGFHSFDFTIGNYLYKEGFQVVQEPLLEILQPISLRGHLSVLQTRARESLRRFPMGRNAIRSFMRSKQQS